jgi:arylsulfatase A-like enzyme
MKVLVLRVPALHLGFLGCYGNTWIETPNLDRLVAEGVVFDQHHADCVGARTYWTGRYAAAGRDSVELPALLQAAGARVVLVDAAAVQSAPDATVLEATLDATVAALESVAAQTRWLCWVDLPSLQPPWHVPAVFPARYLADEADDDEEPPPVDIDNEPLEPLPEPVIGVLDPDDLILWERLRCTYAGAVAYLDAGLGLLIDELRGRGWLEDLLVMVTADRGLALGEHGIVGDCRPWLHDEVVHVPLLVRQPRQAGAGSRIWALTQPVDLAATLLETFKVAPPTLDGRSLLPLLRGEVDSVREWSISHWQSGTAEEWALRSLDWALLVPVNQPDRPTQLYAKPEDRWELNNVIQHHLELAEQLEITLQAVSSACGLRTS